MIICFVVYNTYSNTEVESDIQEMAEADEMSSDAENEEILSKDESTENPSGGEDLTDTQPTPAPEDGSSGDTSSGSSGGGTGPGGVDLDAIRAALGQTEGYSGPNSSFTGENSGSNHGITMAQ